MPSPLGGGGTDGPTWRTDDDPGVTPTGAVDHGYRAAGGARPKTVRKYIERGIEAPVYGPRSVGRPSKLAPFMEFLRERIVAFPDLSAARLTREARELGYAGAYTAVKRFLAAIRPENGPKPYEVRFETPPGVQAQVDFARFVVEFADDPGTSRVVWPIHQSGRMPTAPWSSELRPREFGFRMAPLRTHCFRPRTFSSSVTAAG